MKVMGRPMMKKIPFTDRLQASLDACAPLRNHPANALTATDAAVRALLAIGHDPRGLMGHPARQGQPRLRWSSEHEGYAIARRRALLVAAVILAGLLAVTASAGGYCRIGELQCYEVPGTICSLGGLWSKVPCPTGATPTPTPTAGPTLTPGPTVTPTPAGEPSCSDAEIVWKVIPVPLFREVTGKGPVPAWTGLYTDGTTWFMWLGSSGKWCRVQAQPTATPTLPVPRRHLTLP